MMKNDWNELEFTNWKDFKRMAPSIIQLEISRLGKIINSLSTPDDMHNLLVKARFDLIGFRETISHSQNRKITESELSKLFSALVFISSASERCTDKLKGKMEYISNRLNDLIAKCQMLY
jgi:hypothetical protein